jgi:putative peptidoglycan lipid II flippase
MSTTPTVEKPKRKNAPRPYVNVVEEQADSKTGRIARSTLIVLTAFGAAKVISLIQTFIIAGTFGLSAEYDAYVTANRAPELIVTLIAGGALGYAFIPIFSGFLAKGDQARAWDIASQVLNSIFVVSLVVSINAFIFAPWLVNTVYAPGFEPEIQAITVNMLRILLISTLLFTISGISADILQSHHHFLSPALAPIMFDVGILIGVLFLIEPLGIYGIAWGAVIGAVLHFMVQIPALVHYRASWRPTLGFGSEHFWEVIRLMLPRVAGLGVFYVNFALMNNLASRIGPGAVSAFSWGWQLTQIPQTLLGTALGVVIFPTLAALSEAGDNESKRNAMTGAMKFILIATVPSAVGLVLVGRPLISLLEGGAFDASATAFVYTSVQAFALSVVTLSVLEIAARSFYADRDTITPLWAALVGAAVNAFLALTLSGIWLTSGTMFDLGVGGLGLALSLGVGIEITVLLLILRRRWEWSIRKMLGGVIVRTLLATLAMAIGILLIDALWLQTMPTLGTLWTLARVGILVGSGITIFVGVAVLLGMNEIWDFIQAVLRRKPAAEIVEEAIA